MQSSSASLLKPTTSEATLETQTIESKPNNKTKTKTKKKIKKIKIDGKSLLMNWPGDLEKPTDALHLQEMEDTLQFFIDNKLIKSVNSKLFKKIQALTACQERHWDQFNSSLWESDKFPIILKQIKTIDLTFKTHIEQWFSLSPEEIYRVAANLTDLAAQKLLNSDTVRQTVQLMQYALAIPDIKPSVLTNILTKQAHPELKRSKIILDNKLTFYLGEEKSDYLKTRSHKNWCEVRKVYDSETADQPTYTAKIWERAGGNTEKEILEEAKYSQYYYEHNKDNENQRVFYFFRFRNFKEHYILIPYQPGENLQNYALNEMKTEEITFKEQLNRSYKVFSQVDFFQQRYLVLKDIKPHNVILDKKTEKISLIDFIVQPVWQIKDSDVIYTPGYYPFGNSSNDNFFASSYALSTVMAIFFPSIFPLNQRRIPILLKKEWPIEQQAIVDLYLALRQDPPASSATHCTTEVAMEYLKTLRDTADLTKEKLEEISSKTINNPNPTFRAIVSRTNRYQLFSKALTESKSEAGILFRYARGEHELTPLILKKLSEPSEINKQDSEGYTPIMWAAIKRKEIQLKKFLDHAANIFITNDKGQSVRDLATPKHKDLIDIHEKSPKSLAIAETQKAAARKIKSERAEMPGPGLMLKK